MWSNPWGFYELRIWLGFETRTETQQTVRGLCDECVFVLNTFTHSFFISSHFPFFRLPPSQFVQTVWRHSLLRSFTCKLSFPLPQAMYSFGYSLTQRSSIIPHPKHRSFAKPLLVFLSSYHLFSSIPNSVMSAILMQRWRGRGEYTIILNVMRRYPVLFNISKGVWML